MHTGAANLKETKKEIAIKEFSVPILIVFLLRLIYLIIRSLGFAEICELNIHIGENVWHIMQFIFYSKSNENKRIILLKYGGMKNLSKCLYLIWHMLSWYNFNQNLLKFMSETTWTHENIFELCIHPTQSKPVRISKYFVHVTFMHCVHNIGKVCLYHILDVCEVQA